MGLLEDVMKVLERIPLWQRLAKLPKEHEELAARVKALEDRLSAATGDQCPKCRAMTFTLQSSAPMPGRLGALGAMQDHYLCSSCGYTDTQTRTPK